MAKLNPTGAPTESKVVAGGTYGSITLVIVWILTNYVFKGHLAPDLANLLPGFVSMVVSIGAAWMAHHTPRMDETVAAVRRELVRQSRPPQQGPPSQVSLMPGAVQPQPVPQNPTGLAR